MRFLAILSIVVLLAVGCATTGPTKSPKPFEVIVKVQAVDPSKVEVTTRKDIINKSMEIVNPNGSLSIMTTLIGDEAVVKIYSTLSVFDVSNLHNDIKYLFKMTNIRKLNIFINSPGGDAFSGLALADQIERAKRFGFEVTMEASGIVASAAVPVFAVGTKGRRFATPGTVFMVHEASIWKWPGRETASDIRSQGKLMDLIRDRYIEKMVANTNLTKEEWENMEVKTTWFSAEEAKEWGLVDIID
jgi:ATP-dependent Clp protease protease subunit